MARAALQTVIVLVLFAVILFASAGRLDWPMAWAFLGAYGLIAVAAFALLDRALILERSRPTPGAERADIILASLALVWLFPLPLLVAGLDVGRYHWSPTLPAPLQVTGLGLFLIGNVIGLWAMRCNPFLADFVRVQTERGHRVISDGPYAYVRHPAYAGGVLSSLALPLALASPAALLPALVGVAVLAYRAVREERTLSQGLPGYAAYMARVRWRLFPGVW